MHDRRLLRTFPTLLIALMLAPGCLEPVFDDLEMATDSSSGGLEAGSSTTDPWPPTLTTTAGAIDTAGSDSSGELADRECEVGVSVVCPYGGPEGTEDVGTCRAGARVCDARGRWSACAGEVVPATEDCGTPLDESCDGAGGCTGALEWVRGFAEPLGGVASPTEVGAVTADSAGDVWITGWFQRSVRFGDDTWFTGDQSSYFIAHVDAGGEAVFGYADQQDGALGYGAGLAADGAGKLAISARTEGKLAVAEGAPVYQTTMASGAAVIAMIDERGDHHWSRMVAASAWGSVDASRLAFAGDGRLWAAGGFSSEHVYIETGAVTQVLTNQGGVDGMLVRFEPDGAVSWARGFGDAGSQIIRGVAVDGAGDVWIAGTFTGALHFDGGSLYAGDEAEGSDMFVAKLDPEGRWKWGRAYGGAGTQRFLEIKVDRAGEGVVVGEYGGEALSLGLKTLSNEEAPGAKVVAKISAKGDTLWARSWPCSQYCDIRGLVIDGADQIVVTATVSAGWLSIEGQHFMVPPTDDTIGVLVKLGRDGAQVWPARSYPADVQAAVTRTGEIYLAGRYRGAVSFGASSGQQLDAGEGDDDLVVARVRP